MNGKKKLIETALPLDAVNRESAREKSIRHGHPSTMHLWWARRPLAACRAVLFAQLVDDPSAHPDKFPTEKDQRRERERLFGIMEDLVKWQNINNEKVLRKAREEILKSTGGNPPVVLDPFCGGGSIPLEAQRLGLQVLAGDLNPVAVLITKALVEIPPRFAGRPPVSLFKEQPISGEQSPGEHVETEDILGAQTKTEGILGARAKTEGTLGARASRPHRFVHMRGYLPHFDVPGLVQFITFRLKDSVPSPVIARWKEELRITEITKADDPAMAELRKRIAHYEDQGHGACQLRNARIAEMVQQALLHFDGERYRLLAWCVMPNHVHVLVECMEGWPLADVVHSWKSYTAKEANRALGREGRFWEPEYFDRFIRNEEHFRRTVAYIENNPIIAGLCSHSGDWPFSSAGWEKRDLTFEERTEVVCAGGTPALPGRQAVGEWKGARGLAEDIRYYGRWMRDEAERRIGHLYPKVKAWFDPKSGRHFSDAEVQEWKRAAASGTGHPEGERTAQQCGHPSLSSFLATLSSQDLTVIAWLWARTVKCPNPACGAEMPLISTFWLSKKKGNTAWLEPILEKDGNSAQVSFQVRTGKGSPQNPPKVGRGARFQCLVCNEVTDDSHIKAEGMASRFGSKLLAVVADGPSRRVYFPRTQDQEASANLDTTSWKPEADLPDNTRWFSPPVFGMKTYGHLFTPRQLTALTTFSDLVQEVRERVKADALRAGWPPLGARASRPHYGETQRSSGQEAGQRPALPGEDVPLAEGGTGAQAYADAVATYLALAVDRLADRCSAICSWDSGYTKVRNTFARQAIPMVWDFAEVNPFSDSTGNFQGAVEWVARAVETLPAQSTGIARQQDATERPENMIATAAQATPGSAGVPPTLPLVVSTDPPYYDNIGYADLSDFFYVWLRRSLRAVYPEFFATMLVPKTEELVATPYRFGGSRKAAQRFFEEGLRKCFHWMSRTVSPDVPMTIYYAFKQAERVEADNGNGDTSEGTASTGWETMLEGLVREGFAVTATWPMRTELGNRTVAMGTNALASSIVLACRPRAPDAPETTRRDFLMALKQELPLAIRTLQEGSIAPVDLAQAAIGPGMAVFTRYSRVLEADGSPMRVRTALALINQVLDEYLAEQEGEFDADTRWAVAWFEQFGMGEGPYGVAETLSTAKNTSVSGLQAAGILTAKAGKVRLLRRDELPDNWDPASDNRLTCWEMTQYLVRELADRGSEEAAAGLLARVGSKAQDAHNLAYRLFHICERKKWSGEALGYNALAATWPELVRLSRELKSAPTAGPRQIEMFD